MTRADYESITVPATALDFELLPAHLQELLSEAVDEYVIAMEEGGQIDRESFVKKYELIEQPLIAYLDQIDWLHEETGSSAQHAGFVSANEPEYGLSYSDFEIESEIGRGAMGIVYRAFQKSLQRWVAIKVLPYGSIINEQRTLRFWREAKIAGALEHPGIVSVYGVGREKEICFYAMSLVDGKSLDQHIAEAERLLEDPSHDPKIVDTSSGKSNPLLGAGRFDRVAQLIYEAANAIAVAHAVGVIHRDIKPSNLIVDATGRIKITDFGLAVDTGDMELTRSGEVVGTIRYMSPEQAAGKRGLVDQRSDVYCLGATLYELLTLKPPFDSDSLPKVVRQKEEGTQTAPRSIDPSIPKALQTITLKAMRANASDRYQSAGELARDLQRYLVGKRIFATDRSIFERAADWSRRNSGVLLTSVIALTLLFALAVSFNVAQSSQRLALKRALDEREKHYQGARSAVERLGIQFAEKLEQLPEAAEYRRDLLTRTLDYYVGFLKEAQQDVLLSKDAAEATWKIAQATVGLESIEKAEPIYEEADRQFAQLSRLAPESLATRAEMLSDWAMKYMGGYQGEAKSPQKAIAILDRIATQESLIPSPTLALLKNNRAFVLASLGRTNDAVQAASEAVELLKQTSQLLAAKTRLAPQAQASTHKVGANQSSTGIVRSLTASMLNLSQILDQAGQSSTAMGIAQQCVDFVEQTSEQDSLGKNASMQLKAKAYATLAGLRWKHRGAESAIDNLKYVVNIRVSLLESNPSSTELRWDLAIALNNLGMALSSLDGNESLKAARLAFEKAHTIAKAETEADPRNAIAAHRIANIQNNLGMLLKRLGLRAEAEVALQSASNHINRSFELDSSNDGIAKARERIHQNVQSK